VNQFDMQRLRFSPPELWFDAGVVDDLGPFRHIRLDPRRQSLQEFKASSPARVQRTEL
jgi:hypothetical protein